MSGGARPRRRKAQSTGQKDGDDGSGSDDAPDNMLGARSSITTNPRFLVSHMAHTTYTVDYGVTDSCSVVHNLGYAHNAPGSSTRIVGVCAVRSARAGALRHLVGNLQLFITFALKVATSACNTLT